MSTARLEAFSDGVIAILITIMVLELHMPAWSRACMRCDRSAGLPDVRAELRQPRHLLEQPPPPAHATERVNGLILWANLHLLFWLSLFPFATGWMGENHFAEVPTAAYGVVLLLAAIAYFLLQTAIVREQGPDSVIAAALGDDVKGKASPVIYTAAILLAFVNRWIAIALYVVVSVMWLIPDRRVEQRLRSAAPG